MNWKDFGNSLGQGAAAGAVGSAFNTIFAPAMAKLNLKYANKQLGLQQKYARENFQMENERQDWLLAHQMALTKEGLRNAGYSTADPTMSGPSASVSNIAAPGTPGNGANPPGSSFTYGELVNARLAESQVNLNNASAARQQSDSEKAQAETKQIQELLPARIDEIDAHIAEMLSSKDVNEQQAKQIEEDTKRIGQVVQQLAFENKYNDKYFDYRWKKEKQEFENLVKDGRIKEASAKLADLGIVLGADGLTTLIGVAASGKAGEVMEQLTTAIGTLLAGLPAAFLQIWETIKNTDKYKDNPIFDPDNKNAKKYPKSEREDVWVKKSE